MTDYYVLREDHKAVRVHDFDERWRRQFAHPAERRVAETKVGTAWVSTVFLGINHNFSGKGPPILFETMVFNAQDGDERQTRYCTWEEAETGHAEVVSEMQALTKPGADDAAAQEEYG